MRGFSFKRNKTMTKKIKTGYVEIPVFALCRDEWGQLTIFSYQHVPKNNRYKRIIKRSIKRGKKNSTKVLLQKSEN